MEAARRREGGMMTQTRQTTAERINALIWDHIDNDYGVGITEAAQTIAAEIDRLAADLAQRALERDAAQETLAMVNNMAKANLDAKDAQLAEARATSARVTREAASDQAVYRSDVAALKAEVERLRLPAEAWRSLPEDVQIDAEVAAAARARDAKSAQVARAAQ